MREEVDTVIYPATNYAFESQFLKERSWYPVRMSPRARKKIRYVAIYRIHPVASITHFAEIKSIESFETTSKWKIRLAGRVKKVGPIKYDGNPKCRIQGSRLTSLAKLISAKNISELLPW